ncbi:hypothetical protein PLANPX_1259 [Lacipirellula parvula]|uniref:Uncharacterized protein n=1 Tax=Lacipirellula parvula TaxID=2650471 RepID=A0A5K7X729_9BACT|nr:hypothetical protein PLANPX_1259 [Lacipirellula parvula]
MTSGSLPLEGRAGEGVLNLGARSKYISLTLPLKMRGPQGSIFRSVRDKQA